MPCPPKCGHCRRHREAVRAYHEAREAQLAQAEQVGVGYKTETASFYEEHTPITLRWWLRQTRGEAQIR